MADIVIDQVGMRYGATTALDSATSSVGATDETPVLPALRTAGLVISQGAREAVLANPTPGSLRKLVHDLLMKRLLDGQFEESGLTLTELHTIEEALSKSLIALFHARIKYPDAEPEVRAA